MPRIRPRMKPSTRGILALLMSFAVLAGIVVWLDHDASEGKTTVTVRLWDKQVAAAYRESFDEFERRHPDIRIHLRLVAYDNYAIKLRTDVAGNGADDLFWVNGTYLAQYADAGALGSIEEILDPHSFTQWAPAVVEQYTHDGRLWAVPQLWDPGIALYYNKALLATAGITSDELSRAQWDTDPHRDTFLPLLRRLAATGVWALGASEDLQGTLLPFIGSAGGAMQDGERFTMQNPRTQIALRYVVDLIHQWHVAPSASDTNLNSSFALDQFLHGKIALFESGPYSLATIEQNASFPWGIAPSPAGPAGRVTVSNGIGMAINAHSIHQRAVRETLAWLGSSEGSSPLGTRGAAVPAVLGATASWVTHWQQHGVDTGPFFSENHPVAAPRGTRYTAAALAAKPHLDDLFLGRLSVEEATRRYDETANSFLNP